MAVRFFKCENCGNIATLVKDVGVKLNCCGSDMKELVPGSVDAATEKHVPVVEVKGNEVFVKVGEVAHPMMDNHYIGFIALETAQGVQIKYLDPNDEAAEATFALADADRAVCAYEYCNLHGLWKKDL